VLRNGEKVGEHLTRDLPKRQLIPLMLGREFEEITAAGETPAVPAHTGTFVQARGIARKGMLHPFDLDIAKGEVVGLAGLLGSGRTEAAQLLFGITRSDAGELLVNGKTIRIRSPRDAVRQGFGMCPEDRKSEGIIPELSVRENIVLALQAKQGWFKYLTYAEQETIAQEMIAALHIVTPDSSKPVGELSGGNQQKVILARWLASQPQFLILDEPTRGIDVGAHAEVINIIKRLCSEGLALLVISSELSEVVEYSNRVAVLFDRKKLTELTGADVNETTVMQAIAGK